MGFASFQQMQPVTTTTKTFISRYTDPNMDIGQEEQRIIWQNPLPNHFWSLPLGKHQAGGFGSKQKFSYHTGVDLLCNHMQPLAAVEAGTIVGIQNFSKKNTNEKKSPWFNNTRVILIEGKSGVVAYCNVIEGADTKVGQKVEAGDVLGNVIKINKGKSNKNDVCMLHLELYEEGTRKRVAWSFMFPKPPQLLDPSIHLVSIITNSKSNMIFRRR